MIPNAKLLRRGVAALALVACYPKPQTVVVPANDPTPPTALWLQAEIPGEPLANVMPGSPDTGATAGHAEVIRVTARGTDGDGGLKNVRVFLNIGRGRPGAIIGPGLAGAPFAQDSSTATVGGQTEATRSVSFDIATDTMMRGSSDLLLELSAEAVNFSGATVSTSLLRIRVSVLNLRLHIVALRNDDGTFAFDATPADFQRLLSRTNRLFSKSGLRLTFNPTTDWEPLDRTALNREQAGWVAIADSIVGQHPASIVGIMRWGPGADRTGNANAYPPPGASAKHARVGDVTQRYVMLENKVRDTEFDFLNLFGGSHFAHELGHFLGLYHTFVDWTDSLSVVYAPVWGATPATQAQVDQGVVAFISANGGTIWALDGDQINDTPPDPSPLLYRRHDNQDVCVTPSITVTGTMSGSPVSFTFDPDIGNTMGYWGPCGNDAAGVPLPLHFSRGQMARMRAVVMNDTSRSRLIVGQVVP